MSGDNEIIWRATFVIAAALGMTFTARLIWKTRATTSPIGPFRRHRWIVVVLYLLVLIFGAAPELAKPLNLACRLRRPTNPVVRSGPESSKGDERCACDAIILPSTITTETPDGVIPSGVCTDLTIKPGLWRAPSVR